MELSSSGAKFIQSFEGCVLHPYLDQAGTPTIGWGMTYYPDTGAKVTMADPTITQEQADIYFTLMVKPYSTGVIEDIGSTAINQNQFDSLVDFCYNLGVGAFNSSTLLQHVKINAVVEEDFTLYDHVGKQVSVGLLNRRSAEYQLFIKPITIMEPTGTSVTPEATSGSNEPVIVTPETLQVITVKSITIVYDKAVNGQPTEAGVSQAVTPTAELCAALKDSTFIESGWNIQITS